MDDAMIAFKPARAIWVKTLCDHPLEFCPFIWMEGLMGAFT
jgi:hypothetical protein